MVEASSERVARKRIFSQKHPLFQSMDESSLCFDSDHKLNRPITQACTKEGELLPCQRCIVRNLRDTSGGINIL
jgi:hypothetical protein